jgi:hypothetical protein
LRKVKLNLEGARGGRPIQIRSTPRLKTNRTLARVATQNPAPVAFGTFGAGLLCPVGEAARTRIMKKREPFPKEVLDREQRASEALEAAHKLPSGPMRIDALKKAAKLRDDAEDQMKAARSAD